MVNIDIQNTNWFQNDGTRNSLKKISLSGCNLRGLFPCCIEFQYPITAIAGVNGSGKSTILALVTCAYHNNTEFFPQNKIGHNFQYYTYRDFFVFTQADRGLAGNIKITSEYLVKNPQTNSIEVRTDIRKKRVNGKWNEYKNRPKRVVSFLGINRILPPSESQTHKNYQRYFVNSQLSEEQNKLLKECMSKIFGHNYTSVQLYSHNRYNLFSVNRETNYSGFNMGAGENAVLTLLYEIITAGSGALIVIDEIELGLHISAQKVLMNVLKELIFKYKSQIVCSTHSEYILRSLPPEGRILIKSTSNHTYIYSGVTPEFALGLLSDQQIPEIHIFVEDEKAKLFLSLILSRDLRRRVGIIVIGSADNSIPQQMEAYYRENNSNFCSIMDGDKKTSKEKTTRKIAARLADRHDRTKDQMESYFQERMSYLPGNVHPEKYLLEELRDIPNLSCKLPSWGLSEDEFVTILNKALLEDTHFEFIFLESQLSIKEDIVFSDTIKIWAETHLEEVETLNSFVRSRLNEI